MQTLVLIHKAYIKYYKTEVTMLSCLSACFIGNIYMKENEGVGILRGYSSAVPPVFELLSNWCNQQIPVARARCVYCVVGIYWCPYWACRGIAGKLRWLAVNTETYKFLGDIGGNVLTPCMSGTFGCSPRQQTFIGSVCISSSLCRCSGMFPWCRDIKVGVGFYLETTVGSWYRWATQWVWIQG